MAVSTLSTEGISLSVDDIRGMIVRANESNKRDFIVDNLEILENISSLLKHNTYHLLSTIKSDQLVLAISGLLKCAIKCKRNFFVVDILKFADVS